MKSLVLLGEFIPTFPSHVATNAAIAHACTALHATVESVWVSTDEIDTALFERCSGIWVAPGSPYRNMDKTLWAIRHARENRVPCFGT